MESRGWNFRLPGFLAVALVSLWAGSTGTGAELVLGANGRTEYQIIVPEGEPTPAIGAGLHEIARLIQVAFKANGFDLPITDEPNHDPEKPGIYLGATDFARNNGVDVAQLKGWSYVHRAVGRDIILAGRDHASPGKLTVAKSRVGAWDRYGTAKAAADFLRQYVGVRFLYPDLGPMIQLPALASVNLLETPALEFLPMPKITAPSDLKVEKTPFIEYHFASPPRGGFYDLANNGFPLVDAMFGVHTHERAIPVEKYREAHPEYFALVRPVGGGALERTRDRQYCISNPQVQELIFQDLIGWLDGGYDTVDLGQSDSFKACQCDACAKLYDTGSDWGEKLWILHRKLAERVLAARPGKRVLIMSYIQTAAPPKTFKEFPSNTRIMLCGTNEEDIAPWRTYEVPGGFTSFIYNWCPNLGSRYTPMRTPRFVEAQAKRFSANHIRSIFRDGAGNLFGLEGPVYYTMGRMYDDPDHNQAKDLVGEFCQAAFGPAAKSMQQFYDQLYHGIELYSEYLGTRAPAWVYHDIYGARRKHLSDPFQFLAFLYPPRLMTALDAELALAEKAASTPKIKARLALVRREFDYLRSLTRVVHLYQAYQTEPDAALYAHLLDAIDARNREIAGYYDSAGRSKPAPGWTTVTFPPLGHNAAHLRLAHNGYQEPYAATPLNWDTKALRAAPLSKTP